MLKNLLNPAARYPAVSVKAVPRICVRFAATVKENADNVLVVAAHTAVAILLSSPLVNA